MLAFGVVELQRVRDTLEHLIGHACEVAAFHPDVVVDAHAGEQGDFFAAEPLDPPVAAVGGQPGLFGGDPGAARGKEVTDFGMVVHVVQR